MTKIDFTKTSDVLSISARNICEGDFLDRIDWISKNKIPIILREKDLEKMEYENLAKKVLKITDKNSSVLIIHTHLDICKRLNLKDIHLPLGTLRKTREKGIDTEGFINIGSSVHSVEEAVEAKNLGATYLLFGHVFETDCKKGLSPRGKSLLNEVVKSVDIPVYALGGINDKTVKELDDINIRGVAVMSGFMKKPYFTGFHFKI